MSAMEIRLKMPLSVYELQEEFHKEFNFLKVEFYALPPVRKQRNKTFNKDKDEATANVTPVREIELNISPNSTVAETKQYLMDKLGIKALIFRKSGSLWIETSLSDSWTLQKQNEVGEELSDNNH